MFGSTDAFEHVNMFVHKPCKEQGFFEVRTVRYLQHWKADGENASSGSNAEVEGS